MMLPDKQRTKEGGISMRVFIACAIILTAAIGLGGCWGAPRKGRCGRAIEARLNGDEIASNYLISACLPLRQKPGRSSSAGAFFAFAPDEPAPSAVHHSTSRAS